MRLLFVVQRYGEDVAGGAEQHCREFAERLVVRGHDVDVLTTCASSYVDWANVYPPGISSLHGVTVHRVPTTIARDTGRFNQLNMRLVAAVRARPLEVQREWMRMQGPQADGIPVWLRQHTHDYDCVIFITYLYWTTWAGVRAVAGTVPTLLHPTAHQEPPLQLSIFDEVFRLPDELAYLTPEEAALVGARFPGVSGSVVGVGVDEPAPADVTAFRRRFALGSAPYLCCVGRVDDAKGATELLHYFAAYKARHADDLKLVLVGESVMDLPSLADVVVTGYVDDEARDAAIAGSVALVHPSYFESFSMVLTEAFALERPALVQRACAVTAGHARRSGAALAYRGFGEFEAAVETLLDSPELRSALGRNGRAYIEREYRWPTVLDRYEELLRRTVDARRGFASRVAERAIR